MNDQMIYACRPGQHPVCFRLSCKVDTKMPAEVVRDMLHANEQLPGWFEVAAKPGARVRRVGWFRYDTTGMLQQEGAHAVRERIAREMLSSDLRFAAGRVQANRESRLLWDLAGEMDNGVLEWDVEPPVPVQGAHQLLLPLRVDPDRREDATTIVDCAGAELLHLFGDSGELDEIVWRVNVHDRLVGALYALLGQASESGAQMGATSERAQAEAVLALVSEHVKAGNADS